MGEVLGLGLSHYPGFIYADSEMAMRVKSTITSPKVPAAPQGPPELAVTDAGRVGRRRGHGLRRQAP